MRYKKVKKHIRRIGKKIVKVKRHKRRVHRRKSPRKDTLHSMMNHFELSHRPLTAAEISREWGYHPRTTRKYLKILRRKSKIRPKVIHGRTYWEKI